MTLNRRIVAVRDSAPQFLLKPSFPVLGTGERRVLSLHERTAASTEFTGRGVTIAFIDSGFYPHRDLDHRVTAHVDATDPTITLGTRFRRDNRQWYVWHGQMTAVIAAGSGQQSDGLYRGLAPDARLVLIKVSNRRRQIKEADILRGLQWLIAHAQDYDIRVANISVGGDFPSDDPDHPLHRAVADLTARGVTVLVSAGNSGRDVLVPPASAAAAITVGGYDDVNSLDTADWLPYANSYGVAVDGAQKPDIVATARWIASPILPGSVMAKQARWLVQLFDLTTRDIRKAIVVLTAGAADLGLTPVEAAAPTADTWARLQALADHHKLIDALHQHVDGTSVSCAVASGIVAQMLEANPRLTPQNIKAILMRTALRLPGTAPEKQGAGVVNASAAVYASLDARNANAEDYRTGTP